MPHQAADTATLSWLDSQAIALLRERDRVQAQLEKYRPVRVKGCSSESFRCAIKLHFPTLSSPPSAATAICPSICALTSSL